MKISQKLDYASRALIHLARHHDGSSVVRADAIAADQEIPPSFLAQILNELKRADLITSRRGKAGGWKLQAEPAAITLLHIVQAVEPNAIPPDNQAADPLGQAWDRLSRAMRQVLETTTLESLAREDAPMFYI